MNFLISLTQFLILNQSHFIDLFPANFFSLCFISCLDYGLFRIIFLFLTSIVLLYAVLLKSNFDKITALIAIVIFSFSHTNFTRINFISAAQEVMMSWFILTALLVNQKVKQKLGSNLLIAFIFGLALLCKENAIVFPLLVIVFDWLRSKKVHLQKMLLLSVVSVVYLFIRFVVFQSPMLALDTYVLNFSPRLAANTLYFYGIWAVGGAEFLQDYLATPIQLIDRYHTDFGILGTILIGLLVLNVCSISVLFIFSKKKKQAMLSALLFVLTLSPVLFLPFHKFTIQMTIPMMCFAVCVAMLCKQKPRWVTILVLSLLLVLNITTLYLTGRSHYTVQRAQISRSIYTYFTEKYAKYPEDSYFVLTNASTPGSNIAEWGSSKQISLALGGSGFVKVFYKNPDAEMLYEDIPFTWPIDKKPIYLDSALFLK